MYIVYVHCLVIQTSVYVKPFHCTCADSLYFSRKFKSKNYGGTSTFESFLPAFPYLTILLHEWLVRLKNSKYNYMYL